MQPKKDDKSFMKAAEVLSYLNIRHQTLYAYASRGLVRSFKQKERKGNLYSREDVERLKARADARSGHGAVAASAMQLGEPIIPTSVTEIAVDGPRYRGRSAVDLASRSTPFEAVAELLWTGLPPEDGVLWEVNPLPVEVRKLCDSVGWVSTGDQFMEALAMLTLALGMSRGGVAHRLRRGNALDSAKQVLHLIVGCMGYLTKSAKFSPSKTGDSVQQSVLRALGGAASVENLRAAGAILVLLADHELAPASFASRVAASSGASLHGCLASAMCTHAGVKVGQVYAQAEDFLESGRTRATLLKRMAAHRDQGREVPGFTHPLYPRGDPRAVHLLNLCASRDRCSPRLREFMGFVEVAKTEFGLLPRVELAVVALCNEMDLPRGSGGAMFALARSAGWVAHVLEQRLSPILLRPRAKFFGA
jgi:citrate synthase